MLDVAMFKTNLFWTIQLTHLFVGPLFLTFVSATTINRPVFLESKSSGNKIEALPYHMEKRIHDPSFDHPIVLGSHDKASEFAELPASEARKRLQEILGETDTNGDRMLNEKEMYEWILQSFRSLDKEEAKERLKAADRDSSGELSWPEYLLAAFSARDIDGENANLRTLAGKPVDDATAKRMSRERELWEEADTDGDEKLSLDEFINFNYPGLSPPMLVVAHRQLMAKDDNGDDTLSFEELYSDSNYQHIPMEDRWLMAKVLNDLDGNNDNKITSDELRSYLIDPYHTDVHRQVTHLMEGTDDNLDGFLSFQEVVDNIDNFVGSSGREEDAGHRVDEL